MMEDEAKMRDETEKEAQTDTPDTGEIHLRDMPNVLIGLLEIPEKKNGEKGQKEMTKQENDRKLILQSFYVQMTAIAGKYLLVEFV